MRVQIAVLIACISRERDQSSCASTPLLSLANATNAQAARARRRASENCASSTGLRRGRSFGSRLVNSPSTDLRCCRNRLDTTVRSPERSMARTMRSKMAAS